MRTLERALQVHFATLSALGGLLLASGEVGSMLPLVAVLAALMSYLFVDRWDWFALPTPVAYIGMGIVAAVCMVEFLMTSSSNQLAVVAQLLVWVLVVLLFQRKNMRVFEQIGVFCLLELIVAAVFNSALAFGLMLIPFAVVGLRALVLLQGLATALAAAEQDHDVVKTSAPVASNLVARRAARLPRYGIAVLTPSVVWVAVMFFYGLPRVDGAASTSVVGGRTTTGFDDTLTLDQVGELLSNRDLVMRMRLTDRNTGLAYEPRDPVYLRGQTLEIYDLLGGSGLWQASSNQALMDGTILPEPYSPRSRSYIPLFDDVKVTIELQPLTTRETLFAIAPYHSASARSSIQHFPGSWLLRRDKEAGKGRFTYDFGTFSFSNQVQTKFIRYFADSDRRYGILPQVTESLRDDMRQFDPVRMPTVVAEANRVVSAINTINPSPYQIAAAMEQYLSTDPSFAYTLSLTERRDRNIDPIDEFLARYRRGHCQYFASAMVMMLRSQGIPARIVVGYRTDEYNPIGKNYVVRQLHAHSWVEVLIDNKDVPLGAMLAGQPNDGPILARFDPTPSSSDDEDAKAGRVEHIYDFAQSLWNSYVLDMNGDRQNEALFGADSNGGMSGAYTNMIQAIRNFAIQANSGELGAGSFAVSNLFSWRGALLGIIMALIAFGLYQIGLPRWFHWRFIAPRVAARRRRQTSSITFYEQMCDLLARVNLVRREGQTPLEFVEETTLMLNTAPGQVRPVSPNVQGQSVAAAMSSIIGTFYRVRFGGQPDLSAEDRQRVDNSLQTIVQWVEVQSTDTSSN